MEHDHARAAHCRRHPGAGDNQRVEFAGIRGVDRLRRNLGGERGTESGDDAGNEHRPSDTEGVARVATLMASERHPTSCSAT